MNRSDRFTNINFNRPRVPQRLIPVIIADVIFILLWWLAAQGTVFWILLITISILVWVATYSWRSVLLVLINFLHYLGTR